MLLPPLCFMSLYAGFPYARNGRLAKVRESLLHECNTRCHCDPRVRERRLEEEEKKNSRRRAKTGISLSRCSLLSCRYRPHIILPILYFFLPFLPYHDTMIVCSFLLFLLVCSSVTTAMFLRPFCTCAFRSSYVTGACFLD